MSSRNIESFYDEMSREYEYRYSPNPITNSVVEEVIRMIPSNSKVLDVGCGSGTVVSAPFAAAGCEVTGIDLSAQMIDACRRCINGTFIKTDMTLYHPLDSFDVIVAAFSLFHISEQQTYSMLFKFAEWLHPGGLLIIGTILTPEFLAANDNADVVPDEHGILHSVKVTFMGKSVAYTGFPAAVWESYITEAGFDVEFTRTGTYIPCAPQATPEQQYFIVAAKSQLHPLMGPYPLPRTVRAPHSEIAWAQFPENIVRPGFRELKHVLRHNYKTLRIDSGFEAKLSTTLQPPVTITERNGELYSLRTAELELPFGDDEPDHYGHAFVDSIVCLPTPSSHFDALVVVRSLHTVDVEELKTTLGGLCRAMNTSTSDARIVVVQAAPDNEIIRLVNKVCAPLSDRDKTPIHHGILLDRASEMFSKIGFNIIEIRRIDGGHCIFPENDLTIRCWTAAKVFSEVFYEGDKNIPAMREALMSALRIHFKQSPHMVRNQAVMMIARPAGSSP